MRTKQTETVRTHAPNAPEFRRAILENRPGPASGRPIFCTSKSFNTQLPNNFLREAGVFLSDRVIEAALREAGEIS